MDCSMMFNLTSAIRKERFHMTVRELAKQIGVSPATISIVLNGKKGVSEDTRKKVLDAVKACQYTPPARKPKSGKNVLLVKYYKSGMLVEENQGFISMIIDSIEEQLRAEQLGMTMTVVKTGLKSALDSIDYSKYCGMFLIATEVMRDEFSALDSIPIPFVVVDNTVPNHYCSSVCMNNAENVYIALQYCKECGHTELGYLGSTTGAENFNERHVAFLRYVKELNFQFNPKNEFRVKPTMLGAHDDFFRILDQTPVLPSCFFAENDTIALGSGHIHHSGRYHASGTGLGSTHGQMILFQQIRHCHLKTHLLIRGEYSFLKTVFYLLLHRRNEGQPLLSASRPGSNP